MELALKLQAIRKKMTSSHSNERNYSPDELEAIKEAKNYKCINTKEERELFVGAICAAKQWGRSVTPKKKN